MTLGLRWEYQTKPHEDPPFRAEPILANGQFTGKIGIPPGSSGALPVSTAADLPLIPGAAESCKSLGLPDGCLIAYKNGCSRGWG